MGLIRGTNIQRVERLDPMVAEILRHKTPAERVAMVFEADRDMRQMLLSVLTSEHPDWSSEQIRQEITRRWLRGTE